MILTPEALGLITTLDAAFETRRQELLAERCRRRARLATGEEQLDFRPETAWIREGDWRVAAAPCSEDVADFEDTLSPTWPNLMAAVAAAEGRVVRPRGWHLPESNVLINGRPVAAALVDFALALIHSGPRFCLPKLESHLEARLWNDVFALAQKELGLAPGTIRVRVLIETVTAAFEIDEILYELREHCCGLEGDRWDYLASIVRNFPGVLLPEPDQLTETVPFLRAYRDLLARTRDRRVLGQMMDGAVTAQRLLDFGSAEVEVSEAGLRSRIAVTARYLDAWLDGRGTVSVFGVMEDAATAEISRCLVWQWVRHELFPRALVERLLWEETAGLGHGGQVFDLFVQTALGPQLPAFLTSRAYSHYLHEPDLLAQAA